MPIEPSSGSGTPTHRIDLTSKCGKTSVPWTWFSVSHTSGNARPRAAVRSALGRYSSVVQFVARGERRGRGHPHGFPSYSMENVIST